MKPKKRVPGNSIRIELSEQSITILQVLASQGVHGTTPEAVAGRMIDASLVPFVKVPIFSVRVDGRLAITEFK